MEHTNRKLIISLYFVIGLLLLINTLIFPTLYKDITVNCICTCNLEEQETIEIETETEVNETETETETETVEDKEIVIENQVAKPYTDEDLYVLSHVIYGEASGGSKELQIGVGSVVLNRVKYDKYPNTIKDVVFQKGQYACTWDGNYNKEPDQQAIDVAIYLLENGSQYPEYVIFQAQFKQGDRTYKQIGNTYFCYWNKDVK